VLRVVCRCSTRRRRRRSARRITLPKTWCSSGYRTGLPACERTRAKKTAWRQKARGIKGRGGGERRKKLRVADKHGKQEMPVARARVSQTGK
jgi:hypothetical protein